MGGCNHEATQPSPALSFCPILHPVLQTVIHSPGRVDGGAEKESPPTLYNPGFWKEPGEGKLPVQGLIVRSHAQEPGWWVTSPHRRTQRNPSPLRWTQRRALHIPGTGLAQLPTRTSGGSHTKWEGREEKGGACGDALPGVQCSLRGFRWLGKWFLLSTKKNHHPFAQASTRPSPKSQCSSEGRKTGQRCKRGEPYADRIE